MDIQQKNESIWSEIKRFRNGLPRHPRDCSFICIKVGSRLRIRIKSHKYSQEANCQFPKAIREEGRLYTAPASDVSMVGTRGKFYYRVRKANIKIVGSCYDIEEDVTDVEDPKVKEIFEEGGSECIVCMDANYEVVIVPCGPYGLCKECASSIQGTTSGCPICRGDIAVLVTRDQLQK